MSLTPEHVQEDLSVAYIRAIAAKAGFNCGRPGGHDYGTDLEISLVEIDEDGKRDSTGRSLRIQAKATYTVDLSCEGPITYRLKRSDYNKLAKETGYASPRILVLYCMPRDDKEWLDVRDHQQAVLKNCGYWLSLRGRERTKNKDKISVKIPKDHVFNESSLRWIMSTIQLFEARL